MKMEKEVQIKITQNGQWKNLRLRNKYGVAEVDGKKTRVVKEQGINPGEYIMITKKTGEGKQIETKYGTSYLCVVEYLDQDCSFFLKEKYYEEYKKMPVGTPFKLGIEATSFFNEQTGMEVPYEAIRFSEK
jgi:hypothetical protein